MFNNESLSVGIISATQIITAMFQNSIVNNEKTQTAYMHGSMGLGKSACINDVRANIERLMERKTVVIDLRLSAMEESTIQGMPYTAQATADDYLKHMYYSTPQWWPNDPDVLYIVFLDELSNALKPQQQAAYRLVLDRSVHNGATLGKNVMIVAAGNTRIDGTGAKDVLPALANRFDVHLYIDDQKAGADFLSYAVNNDIHRDVVSYLNWKKENIVRKPTGDAFARPRTWESVSKHLKNKFLDQWMLPIMVCGAVGAEVGTDFLTYREFNRHLPDWNALREGDTSFMVPSDKMIQWAITTPVAFELIRAMKEDNILYIKALVSIIKQLPDELVIVLFRTIKFDMTNALKIFNHTVIMEQYNRVKGSMK